MEGFYGRRPNLVRKRNKHEGVPGPDVQVVGVEQKGGISAGLLRRARRHFELHIFVWDILLCVVHSVGAAGGLRRVRTAPRSPRQGWARRGEVDRPDAPDDTHQLTPHDRVAPIRTDAEVERDVHVPRARDVAHGHAPAVKVDGDDFVLEKYTDGRVGEGFAQEIFVQIRATDGINTLAPERASKRARGWTHGRCGRRWARMK